MCTGMWIRQEKDGHPELSVEYPHKNSHLDCKFHFTLFILISFYKDANNLMFCSVSFIMFSKSLLISWWNLWFFPPDSIQRRSQCKEHQTFSNFEISGWSGAKFEDYHMRRWSPCSSIYVRWPSTQIWSIHSWRKGDHNLHGTTVALLKENFQAESHFQKSAACEGLISLQSLLKLMTRLSHPLPKGSLQLPSTRPLLIWPPE